MKKIILTYGLISGTIVAALLFLSMPLWESGVLNFSNGMVAGYTTMVIALSLVFFGIKSWRDNYNEGNLKFWKGVQIGLLITLIASVMYCLAWEACYHTVASDFTSQMTDYYIKEKEASGASPDQMAEYKKEMAEFEVMYDQPFIRFAYTLFEILPVGLVITLISAALLRRKEFLPVEQS